MNKIKTPCINVCRYTNKGCIACHRTIEEITDWTSYTNKQRKEIMDRVREEKLNSSTDYYGYP